MTTPVPPQADPVPSPPEPPGPVAVVAVHGVADQQPGESACAVTDLLLRLRDEAGEELYGAFRETAVRIPLQPVRPAAAPMPPPKTAKRESPLDMNERPDYVVEAIRSEAEGAIVPETDAEAKEHDEPPSEASPHHAFNLSMVRDYPGSRGAYDTTRLEGRRRDDDRPVHVYELHWADLSRLGDGLVALLGAFYQLALHLPHLGRLTVDHALFEHRDTADASAWKLFARVHGRAVRVLTLFLPLSVLLMLLSVSGLAPLAIGSKPLVATIFLAASALAVVAVVRYRVRRDPGCWWTLWWLCLPFAVMGAAVGLGRELWFGETVPAGVPTPEQFLLTVWVLLAVGVYWLVVRAYEVHRPGVRRWGLMALPICYVAPMIIVLLSAHGHERVLVARQLTEGVLRLFEAHIYLALLVAFVLYGFGLVSALLGAVRILRAEAGAARRRAKRVVWTAVATLGLASALFYAVTLVLGAGTLAAAKPLLEEHPITCPPKDGTPTGDARWVEHEAWLPLAQKHFARSLKYQKNEWKEVWQEEKCPPDHLASTPGIVAVLAGLAFVVFLMIWGLGPAVWREVRPPDPSEARELSASADLGRWLDRAYGSIAIALVVLFLLVFIVSPAITLAYFFDLLQDDAVVAEGLRTFGGRLLVTAGGILVASAVGLAFHGRLRRVALGFRPVLDVALDVDGYMRNLPADGTPRARIFERYASLLRYLTAWRDEDGRPYESIVVIAHSQGSVISVDLLDFLIKEPDPELPWLRRIGAGDESAAEPRLKLFTMGTPLAQLYAANFPHLYSWITGEPPAWFPPSAEPPSEPDRRFEERSDGRHRTAHEITEPRWPAPRDLGLSKWVNTYRTGDYVGRALWRRDGDELSRDAARHPDAGDEVDYDASEDRAGTRREFSLGVGAHTHYWDHTAEAVAFELDLLIIGGP